MWKCERLNVYIHFFSFRCNKYVPWWGNIRGSNNVIETKMHISNSFIYISGSVLSKRQLFDSQ